MSSLEAALERLSTETGKKPGSILSACEFYGIDPRKARGTPDPDIGGAHIVEGTRCGYVV